jgi:hypothetical protein
VVRGLIVKYQSPTVSSDKTKLPKAVARPCPGIVLVDRALWYVCALVYDGAVDSVWPPWCCPLRKDSIEQVHSHSVPSAAREGVRGNLGVGA